MEKLIFIVSDLLEKKVYYGLVCVVFGIVNSARVGVNFSRTSQGPTKSVCVSAFAVMKISELSRGRSCQRKPVKTS